MKIRVVDEKTHEQFESFLDDVFEDVDERFWVRQSLEVTGFAFVGGGAAPAYRIERIK